MTTPLDDGSLVFMAEVTRDNDVTDRAVRNWLKAEKFPPEDGNLHGRKFWLRTTYLKWREDVLSGKYSKVSNLPRPATTSVKAP
jgi:hypothetical protein